MHQQESHGRKIPANLEKLPAVQVVLGGRSVREGDGVDSDDVFDAPQEGVHFRYVLHHGDGARCQRGALRHRHGSAGGRVCRGGRGRVNQN